MAKHNILSLLGLCRKAGMLEIGEEPVEAAARAKDARVLLLAEDAADNTTRRVRHFAEAGDCIWLRIPFTKDDLGSAVGRTSCAILAVTDIGFASNIVRRLADEDPVRYDEAAAKLALKAKRAAERRAEMEAHEKNIRTGKVRKKAQAAAKPAAEQTADQSAQRSEVVAVHSGSRPPRRSNNRPAAKDGPHTGSSRSDSFRKGNTHRSADGKRLSREERARARAKVHPMDRFRNSKPVKKGKGSARKKSESQP